MLPAQDLNEGSALINAFKRHEHLRTVRPKQLHSLRAQQVPSKMHLGHRDKRQNEHRLTRDFVRLDAWPRIRVLPSSQASPQGSFRATPDLPLEGSFDLRMPPEQPIRACWESF